VLILPQKMIFSSASEGKIIRFPLKNTCIGNKTLRPLALRRLAQFLTTNVKEVHQWLQPKKRQRRRSLLRKSQQRRKP
jgi:hypothetical protein